ELHDGPEPVLVADLLCTVDGLRAFHCRRMAIRLTPAFPLDRRELDALASDPAPVAEYHGQRYGAASLRAITTGDPVDAFGAMYAHLWPGWRVPRLPAPPFAFVTRVRAVSAAPGGMEANVVLDTEYDVPSDAWYFAIRHDAAARGPMPLSV